VPLAGVLGAVTPEEVTVWLAASRVPVSQAAKVATPMAVTNSSDINTNNNLLFFFMKIPP